MKQLMIMINGQRWVLSMSVLCLCVGRSELLCMIGVFSMSVVFSYIYVG